MNKLVDIEQIIATLALVCEELAGINIGALIKSGQIVKKGSWYTSTDFDKVPKALINNAWAIRTKNGNVEFKIPTQKAINEAIKVLRKILDSYTTSHNDN